MAPWAFNGYTVAKVAARPSPAAFKARCVFRGNLGSLTFDVTPSGTSRWRAVVRVLRSPIDALSCALLPGSCNLCGSPLPQLSPVPICAVCWSEFSLQAGDFCFRCGDSLDCLPSPAGSAAGVLCKACRMTPPPFARAVAFSVYQGRLRAAIYSLKYDRVHPAAAGLGRLLAQAIAQLAAEAPREMLVVPVPLHRSKNSRRGFNQAGALAGQALGFLRKSHPEWRLTLAPGTLTRQRATDSQAGLTPRQRRLNVRGAFKVSGKPAVAKKHVLLVDDIMTTGATARAAAQTLIRAGAASVWVATLARARRQHGISSAAQFNGDNEMGGFSGNAPEDSAPGAGTYSTDRSSHDQPSF